VDVCRVEDLQGQVAQMDRTERHSGLLVLDASQGEHHPQKEPVLVSNSAFDLVRNSNPKPSLPALHCLLSFDFNLCFQFVMFHILAF
jgi:hypothetical protein